MKLWMLKAYKYAGLGKTQNLLIRAESEHDARNIAAEDEENQYLTICEEVTVEGKPGVIIKDGNSW